MKDNADFRKLLENRQWARLASWIEVHAKTQKPESLHYHASAFIDATGFAVDDWDAWGKSLAAFQRAGVDFNQNLVRQSAFVFGPALARLISRSREGTIEKAIELGLDIEFKNFSPGTGGAAWLSRNHVPHVMADSLTWFVGKIPGHAREHVLGADFCQRLGAFFQKLLHAIEERKRLPIWCQDPRGDRTDDWQRACLDCALELIDLELFDARQFRQGWNESVPENWGEAAPPEIQSKLLQWIQDGCTRNGLVQLDALARMMETQASHDKRTKPKV